MKYMNFKRYKFSTIYKSVNTLGNNLLKTFKIPDFSRYNLSKIYRYIDITRLKRIKTFKIPNFSRYNFSKIYRYIDITRLKHIKIAKFFNSRRYNINELTTINLTRNKVLFLHVPVAIFVFGFFYVTIPTFYNYDKSLIEKICKKQSQNIECLVRGEINYRFYPTPQINVKKVIVRDPKEKTTPIISIDNIVIKLSIKNLLAKEKHKFRKIVSNDYELNLNLKNLREYKNIFKKKNNFIPMIFKSGKIIFFDKENYIATIDNAQIDLNIIKDSTEGTIKGNFLDDSIYINLKSEKIDDKEFTNIILKMKNYNFLTKINLLNLEEQKNNTSGKILLKKDKNKVTAIFDYRDNKLIINNSNLKNIFVDGKLDGIITLLPYFNFNLDVDLNSINFTKLYNYFLSLDKDEKLKFFNINKKINGKLNLYSKKVYSNTNLVKSFESRIKFSNGDIIIDQFLINLGKLGAADLLGSINSDKKYTNLKFESNIFVDNQKKFLSKFGIYNAENISPNLFVSGNFDLENLKSSFYEISGKEEFSNEDINFIEQEFNDYMFEDSYKSLFKFSEFKKFIKSISNEKN